MIRLVYKKACNFEFYSIEITLDSNFSSNFVFKENKICNNSSPTNLRIFL